MCEREVQCSVCARVYGWGGVVQCLVMLRETMSAVIVMGPALLIVEVLSECPSLAS